VQHGFSSATADLASTPVTSASAAATNTVYEYVSSYGDYAYSLNSGSFFLSGYKLTGNSFHLYQKIPQGMTANQVVPLYVCATKISSGANNGKMNIFVAPYAACADVNTSPDAMTIATVLGQPYNNFLGYAFPMNEDQGVVQDLGLVKLYHCINWTTGDTSKSTDRNQCIARMDSNSVPLMDSPGLSFFVKP